MILYIINKYIIFLPKPSKIDGNNMDLIYCLKKKISFSSSSYFIKTRFLIKIAYILAFEF